MAGLSPASMKQSGRRPRAPPGSGFPPQVRSQLSWVLAYGGQCQQRSQRGLSRPPTETASLGDGSYACVLQEVSSYTAARRLTLAVSQNTIQAACCEGYVYSGQVSVVEDRGPVHVGLVYIPVPAHPLSAAETRNARAYFRACAKTYLSCLEADDFSHLWEVEKISQGLLYIASYLRGHGIRVSYYAAPSDPTSPATDLFEDLWQRILPDLASLDVVGMYCITCNFHLAVELAGRIRRECPEIILGCGGPHVSAVPQEALLCGPFDFVGIGEGEDTFLEVVRAVSCREPLAAVAGLACRDSVGPIVTPRRSRRDPVTYPTPAYDLAMINSLPAARIFPNRGCPNACAFCADPWRGQVARLPVRHVIEEIEVLQGRYGTRYLYLGCEDFLFDQARALELARAIHSGFPDMRWTGQCRAYPSLDHDLLDELVACGCVGLEFGVESSNQSILDAVRKNIRVEDVQSCFRIAKRHGLHTHAYWMIGLPGETRETANNTIDTMVRWGADGLVDTWEFKIYIPYPGTPVFDAPERYGVRVLTRSFESYHYLMPPVAATNELSAEEIRELHQAGLERSSEALEARFGRDDIEIGVNFETIENMF